MRAIQHLSDRLFPNPPVLPGDGPRRLPEPGQIGPTGLEQLLRQIAQLLEEGDRQVKPSIEEIASHPLDQAPEDLLHGGSLSLLSGLNEQGPPAVEILREPLEWRMLGHGAIRTIQEPVARKGHTRSRVQRNRGYPAHPAGCQPRGLGATVTRSARRLRMS